MTYYAPYNMTYYANSTTRCRYWVVDCDGELVRSFRSEKNAHVLCGALNEDTNDAMVEKEIRFLGIEE